MTATLIDRSTCTATKHGTAHAYNRHKCRCADARIDRAAHRRASTAKRRSQPPGPPRFFTDATESARQLRALIATGRTQIELAAELGWSTNSVSNAVLQRAQSIDVRRATQIADLYASLGSPPPPPEFDDNDPYVDEIAVERVVYGDRMGLTAAEKQVRLTKAETEVALHLMAALPDVTETHIMRSLHVGQVRARAALDAHRKQHRTAA